MNSFLNRLLYRLLIFNFALGVSASYAMNEQEPVSVAILKFEPVGLGDAKITQALEGTLEAELAQLDNILLVDRLQLDGLLEEQSMSLSGMVNPQQLVQVGQLIGAQIFISGKMVTLDDQYLITARIISTETGRMEATKQVLKGVDLAALDTFATRVAQIVSEKRNELVPPPQDEATLVARMKEVLGETSLPVASFSIPETHISRQIPDPAAETALATLWRELGGNVVVPGNRNPSAELVVTGEAFSEFGMRKGGLVSCIARVEIKAVEAESGRVVFQGAAHSVQVDLGENVAAKKALTAAGNAVGEQLIKALVQDNSNI